MKKKKDNKMKLIKNKIYKEEYILNQKMIFISYQKNQKIGDFKKLKKLN